MSTGDDQLQLLNTRAEPLGYEVVRTEPVGPMVNMGGHPDLRILKNGKPCFKFTWSHEEVDKWLWFRQKDV